MVGHRRSSTVLVSACWQESAIYNRKHTYNFMSDLWMFVCLIFALVSYRCAEAAPIIIDLVEAPLQSKRTLFGIIWSCISTVILCSWTSVHPNVPPPNRWKAHWNRLKLMFWMIIAPELVLAWAVRQFFAARQIRDEYNQSRPGGSKNTGALSLVI